MEEITARQLDHSDCLGIPYIVISGAMLPKERRMSSRREERCDPYKHLLSPAF